MKLYAYRWADSHIHRLHPSAITTWAVCMAFLSMVVADPVVLLTLLGASVPYVFMAKIQKNWYTFMKLGLIVGVVIMLFNTMFVRSGVTVLLILPFSIPTMGQVFISLEAIMYGADMLLRLLTMLTAFSIMTYAVSPDDLLDLLMKARLPSRTAFGTSLATTYVPTLMKDMDDIQLSLASRGYEFERGGGMAYLKRKAAIVMPLLANSLERSIEKSEAMESRAFGSMRERTLFFAKPLTALDRAVLACALLPLAAAGACLLTGAGGFTFYPRLDPILVTDRYLGTLALLALSVLAVAMISPFKRRIDI